MNASTPSAGRKTPADQPGGTSCRLAREQKAPILFISFKNTTTVILRSGIPLMRFINAGYYLHGRAPLIGHNHDYTYDLSGLIRYHFGLFRNQTIYIDLNHHTWCDKYDKFTVKISGEIDYVILAFDNIATLFYSHCFIDENPYDNENSIGTLGFKVMF